MTDVGTVYVVDDDEGVRIGLSALLMAVGYAVRCFSSAQEFLTSERPESPSCLLLDVRMPGLSGLELQNQLRVGEFDSPVIMLTAHADVAMVVRAMKAGAMDFLQKPFNEQELLDRIHEALERDRTKRRLLQEKEGLLQCKAQLTPREQEVMTELVAGNANKSIAIALGISERTVEHHRAKVMQKMQAKSLAQLVEIAVQLRENN